MRVFRVAKVDSVLYCGQWSLDQKATRTTIHVVIYQAAVCVTKTMNNDYVSGPLANKNKNALSVKKWTSTIKNVANWETLNVNSSNTSLTMTMSNE